MLDAEVLLTNINNMLAALPDNRLRESITIANDIKASVRSRITETGIDADGNKMSDNTGETPYSDAVVPYWFFKKKDSNRNPEKQAKELLKKKGYFISYAEWRGQHDLPVDKVTLSFTARMWKSIESFITEHSNDRTVVEVKANNQEDQAKVNYNSERYGNILRLSEDERNALIEDNNFRIQEILREYNLT